VCVCVCVCVCVWFVISSSNVALLADVDGTM